MAPNTSGSGTQGFSVDVLVVDDNDAFRSSCADVLRDSGYRVEAAPDAFVALELLRTLHVRLLVLDINMPGLDGLRLLDQLDEKLDEPPPPTLLVTGFGEEDLIGGVPPNSLLLRKPVPPVDLLAAVERVLAG